MTDQMIYNPEPEYEEDQGARELREFATPWARLWSRMLDVLIWTLPVAYLSSYIFPQFAALEVFEGSGGSALYGAVMLPFALIIDAIILAAFGNTPGRALAGIRVETIRHERLDAGTALNRNARVYLFGYALGFPLFALVAFSRNLQKLNTGKRTSWDEALSTRVYNIGGNTLRTTICAVLVLSLNVAGSIYTSIEEREARDASNQRDAVASASAPDPVAEQLKVAATQVEPTMVDSITRLNGADADGRKLTYHFSLLRRDIDDAEFAEAFRKNILPGICANKSLADLVNEYDVTLGYEYMMPNATEPLTIDVKRSDCAA